MPACASPARARWFAPPVCAVIVVTGMQRSGTSMVCQLLAALGTSFGDPEAWLPADRWNPHGYFEAKPIVDLNSRIITGLPRSRREPVAWLSKVAYLRMPGAAAIEARGERQRGAIEQLGERYAALAVKDPRFCVTLRFWLRWTQVQHVVVCMRHPASVIASMHRRHWLPLNVGARFYAWHVDTLAEHLPAHAVFVDVDALAAGRAAELDTLRAALGLSAGPPSAALLQQVVSAGLFGTAEPAVQRCPAVADAAWHRLVALAASRRTSLANAGTR